MLTVLIGCEQWHRWTGFEPLNYFLYFIFGVGLVCPPPFDFHI